MAVGALGHHIIDEERGCFRGHAVHTLCGWGVCAAYGASET